MKSLKSLTIAAALFSISALHSVAGTVTTSPAAGHNGFIVVAKDGTVTFTATPVNGTVEVDLTVSPEGASVSGSGNSRTVTFGAATMGRVNSCIFTVTHTVDDVVCTNARGYKYDVYVPKLTVQDFAPDIWFFEDGQGDANYPVTRKWTASGLPSGASFKWIINGQSGTVEFANNQQEITGTDLERTITSIGWSSSENNLTLTLDYDGKIVATSATFTSRAPVKFVVVSSVTDDQLNGDTPLTSGFSTRFKYKVNDKFDKKIPQLMIREHFSGNWVSDWSGENWAEPAEANLPLSNNSEFSDQYAYQSGTATPTTVLPTNPAAGQEVQHCPQVYTAGGERNGDGSITGFQIYDIVLYYCRGRAYQE